MQSYKKYSELKESLHRYFNTSEHKKSLHHSSFKLLMQGFF